MRPVCFQFARLQHTSLPCVVITGLLVWMAMMIAKEIQCFQISSFSFAYELILTVFVSHERDFLKDIYTLRFLNINFVFETNQYFVCPCCLDMYMYMYFILLLCIPYMKSFTVYKKDVLISHHAFYSCHLYYVSSIQYIMCTFMSLSLYFSCHYICMLVYMLITRNW
jgi:hypothetical protein